MPALEAAQRTQVAAMRAALRRRIAERGGWIAFDEYLEQVLYAPGLGYYSAGAVKFGAAGDFSTAPEISPLFGACVARQCAPLLRGGGELLELGAGTGALAEVLLLRLAAAAALPDRYFILEVSADLRDRQRAQVRANLGPKPEKGAWQEKRAEMHAALESFRGDSFDPSAMVRAPAKAEREVRMANAMIPVLTPNQRATFAGHLRQRAAHEGRS